MFINFLENAPKTVSAPVIDLTQPEPDHDSSHLSTILSQSVHQPEPTPQPKPASQPSSLFLHHTSLANAMVTGSNYLLKKINIRYILYLQYKKFKIEIILSSCVFPKIKQFPVWNILIRTLNRNMDKQQNSSGSYKNFGFSIFICKIFIFPGNLYREVLVCNSHFVVRILNSKRIF